MEILDDQPSAKRLLPVHEPPQPFSFGKNLLVLFGNVLLGVFLAALFSAVIAVLYGYNINELANALSGHDESAGAGFIRSILGVNQFFTFLVPGFLTAYIIYKQDWLWNLFLKISPSAKNWGLGVLILLCAAPLVQYSYFLNQQIPLPQSMLDQEEAAKQLLSTIMTYEAPYELLINILLIAILPGIGEEIVFRGIIQKNLEWVLKNAHAAIWISAIIFSLIHFQFAGFIPRMILGAVLGYLFYYTQNLWVPIIAHIFNNGVQVMADYFYKEEISSVDIENMDAMPWYAGLISLILVIVLLIVMKKSNHEKLHKPIA